MSIQAALRELADEAKISFYPDMVNDVAEEYGLNPILLTRKFEEQYGMSVEDYFVKAQARDAGSEEREEQALQLRHEIGREYFSKNFRGEIPEYFGNDVTFESGSQYMIIAITGRIIRKGRVVGYKCAAVKHSSNQIRTIQVPIKSLSLQ